MDTMPPLNQDPLVVSRSAVNSTIQFSPLSSLAPRRANFCGPNASTIAIYCEFMVVISVSYLEVGI